MSSDASRNEYAPAIEAPDLGQFPPEVQKYIQACVSGTCRRLLSQSILAGFVCFCFCNFCEGYSFKLNFLASPILSLF